MKKYLSKIEKLVQSYAWWNAIFYKENKEEEEKNNGKHKIGGLFHKRKIVSDKHIVFH